jgi:hypothetical protein
MDFRRLGKNVEAYALLIEIHYRHYLYYSNMFVATAIAYACYRTRLGTLWPMGWLDVLFAFLEIVFFATSRDTLRKYYARGQQLLGTSSQPARSAGGLERRKQPSPEVPCQSPNEVTQTDSDHEADDPQLA